MQACMLPAMQERIDDNRGDLTFWRKVETDAEEVDVEFCDANDDDNDEEFCCDDELILILNDSQVSPKEGEVESVKLFDEAVEPPSSA